jgi:protein-S-isoprenylcysteine O-methyltransferase Ste14
MEKSTIRFVAAALVGVLALAATSMGQYPRFAIAVIVGLPSLVLLIVSRRQLGKSFSVLPEATELITAGLYSRIQHPMYVFLDLSLVAAIVALDSPILLLVWSILVIVQMLQSRREEKVLAAAFGDGYEVYRSKTWL